MESARSGGGVHVADLLRVPSTGPVHARGGEPDEQGGCPHLCEPRSWHGAPTKGSACAWVAEGAVCSPTQGPACACVIEGAVCSPTQGSYVQLLRLCTEPYLRADEFACSTSAQDSTGVDNVQGTNCMDNSMCIMHAQDLYGRQHMQYFCAKL